MEQNREPRNRLMPLCQLIFDKEGKNIQGNDDSLFNKYYWENWISTCKKRKNETRPPNYTICQDKLKMDKRLKYKSHCHKNYREKQAVKSQTSLIAIFLPNIS